MLKRLRKSYALNQSPLYKLQNHRRLAELLKIDARELHRLSRNGGASYSVWEDTNASGKTRVIESPYPRLKRVQARLASFLNLIQPPDFLTCPVKGRSYVTNARFHVGAGEIVTLDVSSYFPSTTWKRIYWFFNKRLCMASDVAWTLASLATFGSHLPTGSPLSPVLSYLAHEDIWLSVARQVHETGCKFTLYMDDITISGDSVPEALVWDVKRQVHAAGLRLNARKERRYVSGEGLVTGIVVTATGVRPTKGSHLKLKRLREEQRAEDDPEARDQISKRLKGLEAQHRQVLREPISATCSRSQV